MPLVDAEEYLLCNDLLVILVETSEELCFEVFGHEFVVISQGDSNSEEASVVLHEVIFSDLPARPISRMPTEASRGKLFPRLPSAQLFTACVSGFKYCKTAAQPTAPAPHREDRPDMLYRQTATILVRILIHL